MTSIFHFETLTLQPSYLTHCWVLQPMAEPEPCMPHRVNHVWSGCMVLHHEHELCTQNALVLWQTAVALFLHTCKVSCELCLLTCSLDLRLSPQGFDDQPGVEPQRLLSAQRRHHLIQPITVQLDDLQVETGSQGLQFPQSPLPPMPLPFNTEANSPPALPHRLWTLFLLHSQSSMELKHACTNGRQRI